MDEQRRRSDAGVRWAWIVSSILAGTVALAGMSWARTTVQVRTLPERIMEAVLLLVPPAQFEGSIERFGPAAKDYALYATDVGMVIALAVIAYVAALTVRRPWLLLGLGVALWLVAMLVVLPLTGGGFFAGALLQSPLLVTVVYLGIGLAYASVLLLGTALLPALNGRDGAASALARSGRRALLTGIAATVASFIATLLLGRSAGRVASSLPLAPVPTAGTSGPIALPAATPADAQTVAPAATTAAPAGGGTGAASEAAGAAGATAAAATTSAPPTATISVAATSADATTSASAPATGAATSTAAPTTEATVSRPAPPSTPALLYPQPPPERAVARDKDGAMLAVNRPKGVQQPAVTPNSDFYVVTKNAAGDPRLEARDWRVVLDGAVVHPVQVDYLTLRRLPSVSSYKALECISNLVAKCELTSFGCDLISTAKWTGARLSDVLGLAGGLQPGVTTIVAIGADEYTSALPTSVVNDPQTLLAYMMNDSVLPREHGFPVRLIVPDHYGYKNTKWLVSIKPLTQPFRDWYAQRNWTPEGIVKTMSRIDVPAPGAAVPAGVNRIAGIAYGGARGVGKVEFSADAGKTWQPAALEPALGKDAFVRWSGSFTVAAGASIQLVARASDGTGKLQIEQFSLPEPSGGAGWNSITVHSR